MKTVWSAARWNLGIRSWELHHEHRRDALFSKNWIRRLKSLILNGTWRFLCEVDWGRRIFEKYFGHVWGLILDLKAKTLSESNLFNAASAHIGFWSWLCGNDGFLNHGRVEFWRFCSGENRLRNRCFPPSKTWGWRIERDDATIPTSYAEFSQTTLASRCEHCLAHSSTSWGS